MKPLFVIVALAAFLAGSGALAGARQHYQAGQDYYSQGRYDKAIEEFSEAYRLDSTKHLLLYNIAQAYEKLGNIEKAIENLELFLSRDPETEDKVSVQNKIDNLRARIAETGIRVTASEPGAAITVDDAVVATTPVEKVITLAAGAHKVRISKNGFKEFHINVAVASGSAVPVEAVLEPLAAGPPPEPPAPAGEAPPEKSVKSDKAEEKPGKKIDAQDVAPWVLAGVGGAAAIVGLGVLGGMALSDDNHDQAVLADIVGWSGVGVFVAGAVWGIVHVVQGKKTGEKLKAGAEPVAVVPLVDRRGAGVAASFTF